MPNRITFTACLAYAWCLVGIPSNPDDEDSEVKEERQIRTASGDDAAEAANNLVERFNLDPATEVRVVALAIDADDPAAPGAEVNVPAGGAPVAAFDPAARVKE